MRVALPALVLAGCANVLGIPSETTVETFTIEANVLGVHGASDDPLRLTLTTDSGEQSLDITGDGVASFTGGLLNGATYQVRGPAMCSISAPGSTIDGMNARVEVRCDGLLTLADFNFSAPMETTGVAPNFRTYGSVLTQRTTLKPKPYYEGAAGSTAQGFRGGAMVDVLGVPVTHNDSFEARVSNVVAMLPTTTRSYFTSLDLVGPPAQFGYGKSPAAANSGHYGTAIDTFENYVLVGLPDAGSGKAVLYSRYGRTWTEEAVFDGVTSSSRFGASVAISKDFVAGKLVVAVGAPGENKVYVHKQNGMMWDRTMLPGTGDYGSTLAVEKRPPNGVLLLIGAPGADTTVVGSGRVDAFNIQTMAPAPGFEAITPTAGARFGATIAIALSDSRRGAAIGAPNEISSGDAAIPGSVEAGGVYLFRLDKSLPPSRITATNPGAMDHFGASVAMNDDGSLVAVGAPQEDAGSSTQTDNSMDAAGAVYLFGPAAPSGVYIKSPNIDVGDNFGFAVSLRGNMTDGSLLAVGAPFEDSAAMGVGQSMTDENAPDAGAAYLYSVAGATATFKHYIKASNAAAGDAFGMCVAVAADSLLATAPYEDSNATGWNHGQGDGDIDGDTGAVYAFR